jgi:TatA/E family protein of Tat protein translocase
MLTLSMMQTGHIKGTQGHLFLRMLSIPHMIVVFVVVLVIFGPQKLPELARSFGKLMAEFRKASSDFKNAFEEEMRDLERQARIAELKKQVAEANAATDAALRGSATPTLSVPATTPLAEAANTHSGEILTVSPVAESIPRVDGERPETEAVVAAHSKSEAESAPETPPSHDQQQPA